LADEIPLRQVQVNAEEEKTLSGFGLLTRKPILIVLNLSEGQLPPPEDELMQGRVSRDPCVPLQGKLEMEIAQLPEDEAQVFLEDYDIDEPGLNKVIRFSYDLLGLQSFFTVGQDEVRAWTLRRGATAFEAAGEVHSDLQRGFIRAEVIGVDELIDLGGLTEARAKGKLRLEGKEYIVHEGEIVHIRFNI
jgi:ribosome-binding ATPase